MHKRKLSIWTWTCSTSAAPSSLFHVPNGFAYYVAQDIRQMSREQEHQTVYSPVCKSNGAPVSTAPLSDLRYMFRQTKEGRQAAKPAYAPINYAVRCVIKRRLIFNNE